MGSDDVWMLPKLIKLEHENAELRKALIDCQTYSADADRKAHEYKNMLDRMLAKDGVLWTPDGGLSIIRG